MEDEEKARGSQRTRGFHLCSSREEPLSEVTVSQLSQLDFRVVRVGRRPVAPRCPPGSFVSWNSVHAQIGKLHLIDRDGVVLRLPVGCRDGPRRAWRGPDGDFKDLVEFALQQ